MKPIWLPFGLKPKEKKTEDGPRYADLYERGIAAAVDVTLLFLLLSRVFDKISGWFYRHADHDQLMLAEKAESSWEAWHYAWASGLPQLWLANALLQVMVLGLFMVGCQSVWHSTPGKWLLGINVRRRRDMGTPETWRYALRYLALIPSALLFFIVSFNKQRRGLHDMIAGTVVIHLRPEGWYWEQVKRGFRWLRAKLRPPVE